MIGCAFADVLFEVEVLKPVNVAVDAQPPLVVAGTNEPLVPAVGD